MVTVWGDAGRLQTDGAVTLSVAADILHCHLNPHVGGVTDLHGHRIGAMVRVFSHKTVNPCTEVVELQGCIAVDPGTAVRRHAARNGHFNPPVARTAAIDLQL